ncbi:MAG TPA: exodeoxyribonuclease III, partial [Ilumatobacteraceae bacterium]|nr:exodeoxyribonuclease III [Ilumatobacteraceae bacterium]
MRIATWNVNSLKVRLPRIEEWVADMQPDVLCLQETKVSDDAFPTLTFMSMGYESAHHGQGQWNGVAILSKVGLEEVVLNFAEGEPDTDARIITAMCGGVRICSVYVPNGRSLEDDHYQYKLRWMAQLRRHIAALATPDQAMVV